MALQLVDLPAELIYIIIGYLSPTDRYYFRQTCWYFFNSGWRDDEREYAYCPNRSLINHHDLCLRQDHLNCVRFITMDNNNKFKLSILYHSVNIYTYYRNIGKVDNSLFRAIIDNSDKIALNMVVDNYDIIGRLSFHIESILRYSTISFIKLIIHIIYRDDYSAFRKEFKGEIDEIGRPDLIQLISK